VLWQYRRPHNLGGLSPEAINNTGDLACWGSGPPIFETDYLSLWSKGKERHLGTFGPDFNSISSMNDRGDLIVNNQASGGETTYIRRKGKLIPVNNHQCGDSHFYSINNKGQAVGHLCGNAVLWHNGKKKTLPEISNWYSCTPHGLNNRGQIVGCAEYVGSDDTGGRNHAVLWINGKVYSLDNLIPAASGWKLEDALAINNAGQIVGTGKHLGKTCAFFLVPLSR